MVREAGINSFIGWLPCAADPGVESRGVPLWAGDQAPTRRLYPPEGCCQGQVGDQSSQYRLAVTLPAACGKLTEGKLLCTRNQSAATLVHKPSGTWTEAPQGRGLHQYLVTQHQPQTWLPYHYLICPGPVFYLSLCQNMLSKCLSQDRSETVLRSLASSIFRLCLRQKIVLRIQVQVLLNTLTFIKHLFFKKTSMFL